MEPSRVAEKPRYAQKYNEYPRVPCNASSHKVKPPFAMRSSSAIASSLDREANAEEALVHIVETAADSEPSMVACTTNRAMTSP